MFAYEDKEKNPAFKLNLTEAQITLTNYSNHEAQGPARVILNGKFMDSGDTNIDEYRCHISRRTAGSSQFGLNMASPPSHKRDQSFFHQPPSPGMKVMSMYRP